MSDPIERQAAIDALMVWEEGSFWDEECLKHRGEPGWVAPSDVIENLPSAQPYTEAEIQKMQELEQAELQKAYECGRASAQPEIIRCKDCRKHNVHSGYKDDCCPLYEWRGMSYGHEHDYQYCSFAGRREE